MDESIEAVDQLALTLWGAGEIDKAIGLLDQSLRRLTSLLGTDHPMRVDMRSTLGQIMCDQHHLEQAGVIHGEVLECTNTPSGLYSHSVSIRTPQKAVRAR